MQSRVVSFKLKLKFQAYFAHCTRLNFKAKIQIKQKTLSGTIQNLTLKCKFLHLASY
jgi:hypothetical protein